MGNNGKVSRFDIQEWLKLLREKNITEFIHGKLPKELQRRAFIQKANDIGLIESVGNINGRNIWRIVDMKLNKKEKDNERKQNNF